MKDQLIEKVREFREAFGLKQDDFELHKRLLLEEKGEYGEAETLADKADGLADLAFVTAGGMIDGFLKGADIGNSFREIHLNLPCDQQDNDIIDRS